MAKQVRPWPGNSGYTTVTQRARETDESPASAFHQGPPASRRTSKSGCMAAILTFKPSQMRAWHTGGVHAWCTGSLMAGDFRRRVSAEPVDRLAPVRRL